MKARKRQATSVLKNDEVFELYKEILVYYENDSFMDHSYDMRIKPFKNVKNKIGFKFDNTLDQLKESKAQINVFYFKNKKTNVYQWLRHLRNAFAHNRIFTNTKQELILENIVYMTKKEMQTNKNPDLSMYARIESFQKLTEIIKAIKVSKIK